MFVRSSKYHEVRVALRDAQTEAGMAKACMREARVERDRARRELQEAKSDYLHRLMLKRVIVHVKDPEMSIDGVLAAVYPDSVVIRHAKTIASGADVVNLEGDQVIPVIQIAWMQDISLGNVRA